jgi:hypothetical protein
MASGTGGRLNSAAMKTSRPGDHNDMKPKSVATFDTTFCWAVVIDFNVVFVVVGIEMLLESNTCFIVIATYVRLRVAVVDAFRRRGPVPLVSHRLLAETVQRLERRSGWL